MRYMTEANPTSEITMEKVVLSTKAEDDVLSLSSQFDVISSLPNYHHWQISKDDRVRKWHYSSNQGTSPRNLLLNIRFGKEVRDSSMIEVMKLVFNNVYSVSKTKLTRRLKKSRTSYSVQQADGLPSKKVIYID